MSAAPAKMSPDELALRLQQQELVAGFGLFALDPGPLQRLLDEVCRIAAEGLRTSLAKVLRYRSPVDDFLVCAGVGWHAGVVGHGTLGGGLDSPAGYAFETGKPTLSNHLAREDRFRIPALLAEHGVQSAINVVIGRVDQAPFGVLEVDSTRRNDFIESDTAFLQSLANVLAAGLARVEAEEARELMLQDKDLLMREVHHRVTNSLQLVRTILALQSRGVSDETRAQLDSAASRIMSIAAVHRRLYEGASVAEGSVSLFLAALLDDLKDIADGRGIELDAEPIMLSADGLTPVGLIVSELVTNALKYGAGTIKVNVRPVERGIEVVVEDEGAGLAVDIAAPGKRGLGMRLIASLAKGDPARAITIDRSVSHTRVVVVITT